MPIQNRFNTNEAEAVRSILGLGVTSFDDVIDHIASMEIERDVYMLPAPVRTLLELHNDTYARIAMELMGALLTPPLTPQQMADKLDAAIRRVRENAPPQHFFAAVYYEWDYWTFYLISDVRNPDGPTEAIRQAQSFRSSGYTTYVGRTDDERFVNAVNRLGPRLVWSRDSRTWSFHPDDQRYSLTGAAREEAA